MPPIEPEEIVATLDEPISALRPETEPYNREAFQDKIRAVIAVIFVSTFVLTVLGSFIMAARFSGDKDAWPNVKDLIQLVITAQTALLGAAIGFYFGTKFESER